MDTVATIGVYGWTLERFLAALRTAEIERLIDVRQRRGVRGAGYAWANARRLQDTLARAGIDYRHHKELAPTTELRNLQYAEDEKAGVGKRDRSELSVEYADRYREQILGRKDLRALASDLSESRSALLCVEGNPNACHRSLIAQRLAADYGVTVNHFMPGADG